MDAGLAIICGAAGLIGYKVLSDSREDVALQPGQKAPQPFWMSWMDSGNQPATGNGGPTTDQTGKDVANTVQAVSKFAVSFMQWLGSGEEDNSGSTNTNQDWP